MNEEVETMEKQTTDVESEKTVKKGALILFIVIILSLLWYFISDRYAPYTKQARVDGYVVGVAPKVGGLVTKILVKNNQEVNIGDVLFEIDSSQYDIALEKAQSDLQNAQSQVNAGEAGVEKAKAGLLSAIANEIKSRQDYDRLTRLHKEDPGTISVRRIEVSKASLEQAQAGVLSAQAEIERAIEQKGGDNDSNNAIIKSAESAVAKAMLDLKNTQVIASSRGIISDLNTDVGQYANPGSPVMTLIAINEVWINAEFTENNLGHLTVGSEVEILFDAMPGQVYSGTIKSIGLGVSSGTKAQAGTLPSIDNNRDWLRQAQRFPVIISFDVAQDKNLRNQLRIGGQTSVVAYAEKDGIIRMLGELHIRIMSFLSYAY